MTPTGFDEGTPSVADLLLARADDHGTALVTGDRRWTWAEVVAGGAVRAALLASSGDLAPPHVGVLLGNEPEYLLWLTAAALSGAVVVGINPTRRGAELERDVAATDCQLVVTEGKYAPLLDLSLIHI